MAAKEVITKSIKEPLIPMSLIIIFTRLDNIGLLYQILVNYQNRIDIKFQKVKEEYIKKSELEEIISDKLSIDSSEDFDTIAITVEIEKTGIDSLKDKVIDICKGNCGFQLIDDDNDI